MFTRTPAELQVLIANVDQAIYNHDRWYDALVATLMCHLPYDEHDVHEESFRRCRFGQWLYGEGQRMLSDHASYAAIEGEHRRMHELAARLLLTAAENTSIGVRDYELLTSAVKSLRLEAASLKHELDDLLSHVDPLTGVNGRTLLLTVLRELHALVKRDVMPCSVVMMDLDHFKAVNDTYGHQAGDRVLIACTKYVIQHLRPYDKIFRYGGEEFVITLQNAGPEAALGAVKNLREGLANLPVHYNDMLIGVTASFGVAPLDPSHTVEQTLDHADQALYEAKSGGRNRAEIWKGALRSVGPTGS
ncbi:MAG: diguanylate cyclase [Candidatus Acidiferrales bacterium]